MSIFSKTRRFIIFLTLMAAMVLPVMGVQAADLRLGTQLELQTLDTLISSIRFPQVLHTAIFMID